MKKPLPKNSKTGVLGIAALIIFALLLLPMAAGPRLLAEESKPEATPPTHKQAAQQAEALSSMLIEAFNADNLERYMSAYTNDAISLPDQEKPAMGMLGVQMEYQQKFNQGVKLLEFGYISHEMWSCGKYVIAASLEKILLKVPSMPSLVTNFNNCLEVFEVQPDGTLKVKVEAWNNAETPSEPQALQTIQSLADSKFHAIESKPITPEALNEIVEKVKQLDIEFHECFNRHDLDAAAKYYADDAMLMTVNRNPIRGAEAIKAYIIEGSQGAEHVNNNQQIIHAEGNEAMVIIVNQFGWVFKVLETGETVSIPGKGIHIWFKQPDGTWKILLDIHNTNVPLEG